MSQAMPPTVLSLQIQAAIDSYQPPPPGTVGPTLADHVGAQLVGWLSSLPSFRCGGSDSPTRLICYGGDGPVHIFRGGGDWSGPLFRAGDGPTPFGRLTFSPTDDNALKARAAAAQPETPPFSFDPQIGAGNVAQMKPFIWSNTLNIVEGGGVIYAQLLAMRLQIWDTGDWNLFIGYRTFAKVAIKINVALNDGGFRGLCSVSTDWKTLNSTNGFPDCLVFGGNSVCIRQFFSVISDAIRSTDGWGPL